MKPRSELSLPCLFFLASAGLAQPPDSTNGWGYTYDSLRRDLDLWRQSPVLQVDSFGASVQNRALWMVTVQDGSEEGKQRIFVHARTHPGEVQSFYAAREMIRFLSGDAAQAAALRAAYLFHIVPMYNPDGVELGYGRLNANRVDIESNWNKPEPEPEVRALRGLFLRLMDKPNPIRVALNLHSDRVNNCRRFFVYHEASGTSPLYAQLEQEFITKVRNHFVEGIETWDFVKTWQTTQTQYPESFWWLNYRETVMALTFEDANCPGTGQYDRTALALILGSTEYIQAHPNAIRVAGRLRFAPGPRRQGPMPAFPVLIEGRMRWVDAQGRRAQPAFP